MDEKLLNQLTEIQEIGFGLIQEADDSYAQQVFVIVKAVEYSEEAVEEIKETLKKEVVELLSEQVVLPDEFYTDSYERLVNDLQKRLLKQPEYMYVGTHVQLAGKKLLDSYEEHESYGDMSISELDLESTYFYRFMWNEDGLVPERTTHFVLAEELIRQLETDGKPPVLIEAPYVEKEQVEWPQQEDSNWAGEQKEPEWEENFDEWSE